MVVVDMWTSLVGSGARSSELTRYTGLRTELPQDFAEPDQMPLGSVG